MNREQKTTDSIPRAAILQILQVLTRLAASGGRSTFDEVRLFLVKRSQRSAPASRSAMYTVARDVLLDLQRLELLQAGTIPRTQSKLETLSDAPCELTDAGREMADLYKESPGRAFDRLLAAWLNQHPYFRAFIARLHQQPLYIPDVTSVKQFGTEARSDDSLDALACRIVEHCTGRLEPTGFPTSKVEAFTAAVGERVQELGRATVAGLDAKKWVDTVQDKVVIPATLTAEGLPFSDAVTLQHVLKDAKDFFAASWTSSHPQFSVRVVFPTCEFRPSLADEQIITEVIHHGKSFASERFKEALRTAYERAARRPGDYADAYAVRALVCIALQIQPKVFAACLGELLADPASGIYTDLPFDPPPPGEDYVEIDRTRIAIIKLPLSTNGGQ